MIRRTIIRFFFAILGIVFLTAEFPTASLAQFSPACPGMFENMGQNPLNFRGSSAPPEANVTTVGLEINGTEHYVDSSPDSFAKLIFQPRAYIYLFQLGPNGQLLQLLPTDPLEDQAYDVRDYFITEDFRIGMSFGEDGTDGPYHLQVIVSQRQIDWDDTNLCNQVLASTVDRPYEEYVRLSGLEEYEWAADWELYTVLNIGEIGPGDDVKVRFRVEDADDVRLDGGIVCFVEGSCNPEAVSEDPQHNFYVPTFGAAKWLTLNASMEMETPLEFRMSLPPYEQTTTACTVTILGHPDPRSNCKLTRADNMNGADIEITFKP